MYIRYLGNIHNLENYNSLVKGGEKSASILLQKDNGHFFAMPFKDEKAATFFLNKIWDDLSKGTQFLDIDEILESYYTARDYNVM